MERGGLRPGSNGGDRRLASEAAQVARQGRFGKAESRGGGPDPFYQSPIVAWMTASAATAAVSARRIRGPSGIGVT